MSITREAVLERLKSVPGADGKTPLPDTGALSDIIIHAGKVYFSIAVDPARAQALEPLRAAAQAAVAALPGAAGAIVSLTAEQAKGAQAAARPAAQAAPASKTQRVIVPDVKHIIAVASGKGGVGKSTTACNLALALAANGLKVGVLDADIYGPSIPRLFGLKGKPRLKEGRTLMPMENYGCKVMSIGFLVDEQQAMIWRGPMVISAITQLLRDVDWGPLDIMVVDMPPGTGDAQLTMSQQVALSGAVIVSTPQDLALIDARRGIAMFQKVNVPILGLIENMSYFICDQCGKRHDIFAHGGARAEAAAQNVPFLGEVPLHMQIRERADSGLPVVVTDPDGPHAMNYKAMAAKIWTTLQGDGLTRPAPRIVIE